MSKQWNHYETTMTNDGQTMKNTAQLNTTMKTLWKNETAMANRWKTIKQQWTTIQKGSGTPINSAMKQQ